MNMKRCGAFLKNLRQEKKLTQEQLAEHFGISPRTVSRWETGRNMPDLDLLLQLADFYGVDVRELIEGKQNCATNAAMPLRQEVVQYSRERERLLLRQMLFTVLAGGSAWAVSFWVILRFSNIKMAAEWIVANAAFFSVLHLGKTLCSRANHSADGCLAALTALFAALTSANLVLLFLFFPGGSYVNPGLRGFYYVIWVFGGSFSLIWLIHAIAARKRQR